MIFTAPFHQGINTPRNRVLARKLRLVPETQCGGCGSVAIVAADETRIPSFSILRSHGPGFFQKGTASHALVPPLRGSKSGTSTPPPPQLLDVRSERKNVRFAQHELTPFADAGVAHGPWVVVVTVDHWPHPGCHVLAAHQSTSAQHRARYRALRQRFGPGLQGREVRLTSREKRLRAIPQLEFERAEFHWKSRRMERFFNLAEVQR